MALFAPGNIIISRPDLHVWYYQERIRTGGGGEPVLMRSCITISSN